jgi:hypothetical protein
VSRIEKEHLLFSLMEMDGHHSTRVKYLDEHAETGLPSVLRIYGDNDLSRIGRPDVQHFPFAGPENIPRQIKAHLHVLLRTTGQNPSTATRKITKSLGMAGIEENHPEVLSQSP